MLQFEQRQKVFALLPSYHEACVMGAGFCLIAKMFTDSRRYADSQLSVKRYATVDYIFGCSSSATCMYGGRDFDIT